MLFYEEQEDQFEVSGVIDKLKRVQFHNLIRAHFKGLDSRTDGELIKVTRKNKIAKRTNKKQRYEALPQYLNVVVQFNAPKFNTETAISYLCSRLKLTRMEFSFYQSLGYNHSGIVSQQLCIHKGNAEQIIRQQRCKDWNEDIKVGSFERVFLPI